MPYEVILSEEAERKLSSLEPRLRAEVVVHLHHLAESPTTLSRPSAPPAELPGRQVSECDADAHNRFKIFFTYGADEQTLLVSVIGHVRYHG